MSTVLRQPHRRGQRSPLAASALGRFCLAYGLDSEVYDAALAFHIRRAIYRANVGAPRLDKHEASGSASIDGLDAKTMAAWRADIEKIEEAVEDAAGRGAMTLVDALLDREADLPAAAAEAGKRALIALARAYGKRV